jgi:hypothetical protein
MDALPAGEETLSVADPELEVVTPLPGANRPRGSLRIGDGDQANVQPRAARSEWGEPNSALELAMALESEIDPDLLVDPNPILGQDLDLDRHVIGLPGRKRFSGRSGGPAEDPEPDHH